MLLSPIGIMSVLVTASTNKPLTTQAEDIAVASGAVLIPAQEELLMESQVEIVRQVITSVHSGIHQEKLYDLYPPAR